MPATYNERVIASTSVREFFRDSVNSAMLNQALEADEHTVHYVVNVLTVFTRSECLYEQTPEGPTLRPLALMLHEATEARTVRQRDLALQRLGDVSLFIAGFFANTLVRKPVDVDYYVAMGGQAYGSLRDAASDTVRGRAFAGVFGELATKFQGFVDVLWEVSDAARASTACDVLRVYELWLQTGSDRAASLLRRLGISAVAANRSRH